MKAGSHSRFTFYIQLPPQLPDEFPRLIGADTHAGSTFSRIKGSEQAITDKIPRHPAARIPHFYNGHCTAVLQYYLNPTLQRRRLLGILNDVTENIRQPLALHPQREPLAMTLDLGF